MEKDTMCSGAGTDGEGICPPALSPGGGGKGAVLPDKTDNTQESIGATRNILVIKL